MRRPASDAGFTLIELMVTVTCVLVLAAAALPRMQGFLLQGQLEAAKPYLAQIAAKQRMYKIETGTYCCTGYALDENTLSAGLGLTLTDNGDFCFVFVCQSTTLCPQATGPGFIVPTSAGVGSAPDFEVWAILQSSATTAPGPSGTACSTATGKASPTGWAHPAGSGLAGTAGEAVALRYPPPANGMGGIGAYHAVTFQWHDGVTISDAQFP